MQLTNKILGISLLLCGVNAVAAAMPDTQPPTAASTSMKGADVDNSRMNTRDKNGTSVTPQDQKNTESDRKLLAAVRHVIVQDKTLSTGAHNVKIVVQGGAVVLRGPVNSDDEKQKVGAHAKSVQGVVSVDNQLDIKRN